MERKERISHFVECVINGDGQTASKELKVLLKESINQALKNKRQRAQSLLEADLNKKGIKNI